MITIVRSISITAIIAIGLTHSLAVNGMDLSIGADANFADFLVKSMFQGVAMTYSNGGAITERMMMKSGKAALGLVPASFRGLGKEPWIIVIMIIVVLFAHFFLNYTKYGRYMYAVGDNPEAARLSGIPVNKYRTKTS